MMKTKLFFTKALLVAGILIVKASFVFAQAPDIEWEQNYGGSEQDAVIAILHTPDGGYILGGSSLSNDGDVSGNQGNRDYWVVKINAPGSIEWEQNYGGSAYDVLQSIRQTSDGGYILVGNTQSNDGDVGNNYGNSDYWVVKIDDSGAIQWEENYGGSANDYGYDVQQTIDGGYILVGSSSSSDGDVSNNYGASDVWVVKINNTGVVEWEQNYGGSANDFGYKILEATAGYVIAGGSYSTDGDVSDNQGGIDFWILKINTTGAIEWEQNYGGSNSEVLNSISQTTDGGYIFTGSSNSSDGDVGGNNGNSDYWVVKTDAFGVVEWEQNYGGSMGDYPGSIIETVEGGYFIAGESLSSDGDITFSHGEADMWVVKLDNAGSIEWEKSLGGTEDDGGWAVVQIAGGSYVIAGWAKSSNGDVGGNQGDYDAWVVKLESTLGISGNAVAGFAIYPNPTTDLLHIKSKQTIDGVAVYDLLGKVLPLTLRRLAEGGTFAATIDMSGLASGVYVLKVSSGGQEGTYKIIKE